VSEPATAPEIHVQPDEGVDGFDPEAVTIRRTVWGYVGKDGAAHAVYYARWTIGDLDGGCQLLVSLGGWNEGEDEKDRRAIAAQCRVRDNRPAFRIMDASQMAWSEQQFLGQKLTRDEALKDAGIQDAFAVLDRIAADDERVRNFLTAAGKDRRLSEVYCEEAEERMKKGDDEGAVVAATRAMALDPSNHAALFLRGWARGRAGEREAAVADVEAYLEAAPRGRYVKRAGKVLKAWKA